MTNKYAENLQSQQQICEEIVRENKITQELKRLHKSLRVFDFTMGVSVGLIVGAFIVAINMGGAS